MLFILVISVVIGIIGGLWLNHEAKSELKAGKKWFLAIFIACVVCLIASIFLLRNFEDYSALVGAFVLLGTVAFVSYRRSSRNF